MTKPATSCWLWTGSTNRNGYGRVWREHRTQLVHVLTYTALVGEVPTGKVLDHLCRNRRCANPAHLEPVTHSQNTLRGMSPAAQNFRRARREDAIAKNIRRQFVGM